MKSSAISALFAWSSHAAPLTNGWERLTADVDPSASMTIRFALERAEPEALTEALHAISDPHSLRFREYLGDTELSQLVRPRPGAAEAVELWAQSAMGEAAVERSKHGDYVLVHGTAAGVRSAFRDVVQDVAAFRHAEAARLSLRAVAGADAAPSSIVPGALRQHVSAVLDLIEHLPVPPRKRQMLQGQPGDLIEPPVLHELYGLTEDAADVGGRTATSQGVAMFEQAEFRPSDLRAFQDAYKLPEVDFKINGPNDGGYFGEATLDTQWITATGRAVPSWWIARDQFDMLAWCEQVLNMTTPPSVVSISWGSGESNYHAEHMQAGSDCFQKMGAQGITVFTASGDDGTGKQGLFTCKQFDANWPASCPYITTVGGTYLESGTEKGWSMSGGGFSAVFPRPSWQDKAIASYKDSAALPDSSLWSSGGCGKPDIAAVSTNYQVFSAGAAAGTLSGTSAASPAFAGMVSVINDLLVAAGKPTVGFMNPLLYAAAEGSEAGFTGFDVLEGNNKHSGCKAGFPAVEGWDAVTGFGTPTLQKLKALLLAGESLVV